MTEGTSHSLLGTHVYSLIWFIHQKLAGQALHRPVMAIPTLHTRGGDLLGGAYVAARGVMRLILAIPSLRVNDPFLVPCARLFNACFGVPGR